MRLYDAHNHLMDERFSGVEHDLVSAAVGVGVVRMVVNGSCVADWEAVRRLALRHPEVQASYGLHPWYLPTRAEYPAGGYEVDFAFCAPEAEALLRGAIAGLLG